MSRGTEILIVEESLSQAEQLKHILEQHGHKVSVEHDARLALASVRRRKPQIMISAVLLPGMDGYALCREIKADENLKDITVILLTSLAEATDIIRGMECGADNFVTKPYDEKLLMSRVEYILLNRKSRAGAGTQAGVEIVFGGKKYSVTPEHRQMVDLLISTYEAAVQKNLELLRVETELNALNERLEERVRGRTAELVEEVGERKRAEEELRAALSEVERLKNQLLSENVYLREEILSEHNFGEIIGSSPALREVMKKARQVAATDTTVLIVGETGTGKELMARAIHNGSLRKGRPMVKVNCPTLPADLIESELFGHERGAFTGAAASRVGRFELADGATIFLDEIGELPLGLQAKLLRVLQEGEFERLGNSRTIKVNVRVIAATNRDLEAASHDGTFRADLYYRLCVFPIAVPPLRKRREDIPPLVSAFLHRENKRLGKKIEAVPRETMEALQDYPWPGNVRELQSVIARAAIITRGLKLQLAAGLSRHPDGTSPQAETTAPISFSDNGAPLTLDAFERRYIISVLEKAGGRVDGKGGAAEILGLNPNTLRSRIKKLGIRRHAS